MALLFNYRNQFYSQSSVIRRYFTMAGTHKQFWTNPYQNILVTRITSLENNKATFSKTIAYAFSGGQESDEVVLTKVQYDADGKRITQLRAEDENSVTLSNHGAETKIAFDYNKPFAITKTSESDSTPKPVSVLESKLNKQTHEIYYTLPEGHGLSVGDEVVMLINWPNRYTRMRLHFVDELILEIVVQDYKLEKVSANISHQKARVDFQFGDGEKAKLKLGKNANLSSLFPKILERYEQIINANLPILKDFFDQESERRFWKIEGFAQVPCGGTHVVSTKEVGLVNLKRINSAATVAEIIDGAEVRRKVKAERIESTPKEIYYPTPWSFQQDLNQLFEEAPVHEVDEGPSSSGSSSHHSQLSGSPSSPGRTDFFKHKESKSPAHTAEPSQSKEADLPGPSVLKLSQ